MLCLLQAELETRGVIPDRYTASQHNFGIVAMPQKRPSAGPTQQAPARAQMQHVSTLPAMLAPHTAVSSSNISGGSGGSSQHATAGDSLGSRGSRKDSGGEAEAWPKGVSLVVHFA